MSDLPVNFTDATPTDADVHAGAHNDVNAKVNDLVNNAKTYVPVDFNETPGNYPNGVSMWQSSAGAEAGSPVAGALLVITYKLSGSAIRQVAIPRDGTPTSKSYVSWERIGFAGGTPEWSAWRELDPGPLRMVRSGKDANGIFTVVEHHRVEGNRVSRSVLSGGTSPLYTTRTYTEYAGNGTTALRVVTYALAYDGDGELTTETAS